MMNVKECYERFGGNYEEIMRLLMTEARVIKYLLKFRKDTCMQELTKALKEERYEDAFRYAHTLKGVSTNLMMERLVVSSCELTEALRHNETDVEDLYNNVKEDYDLIIEAIRCLEEE